MSGLQGSLKDLGSLFDRFKMDLRASPKRSERRFIVRFGGLVPSYYAGDVHTCHHTEAETFGSPEEAKKALGDKYSESLRGISIVDAETLEFVENVNW